MDPGLTLLVIFLLGMLLVGLLAARGRLGPLGRRHDIAPDPDHDQDPPAGEDSEAAPRRPSFGAARYRTRRKKN